MTMPGALMERRLHASVMGTVRTDNGNPTTKKEGWGSETKTVSLTGAAAGYTAEQSLCTSGIISRNFQN